ncbi:MAG TPA: hypothetical protein VIU63_10820 [Nitrospira sp.]
MSKLRIEGGSLLLVLVLTSCASPFSPLQSDVSPMPYDPEMAALGIQVRGFSSCRECMSPQIIFAKVNPAQPFNVEELVTSKYRMEDRFYLLNAPPGRYVPIAALRWRSSGRYGFKLEKFFFTREVLKLAERAAAPGTLTLIGDLAIGQQESLSELNGEDDVPVHYWEELSRRTKDSSDSYQVSIVRFSDGSETEEGLTASVVEDMRKVGWLVQRHADHFIIGH